MKEFAFLGALRGAIDAGEIDEKALHITAGSPLCVLDGGDAVNITQLSRFEGDDEEICVPGMDMETVLRELFPKALIAPNARKIEARRAVLPEDDWSKE